MKSTKPKIVLYTNAEPVRFCNTPIFFKYKRFLKSPKMMPSLADYANMTAAVYWAERLGINSPRKQESNCRTYGKKIFVMLIGFFHHGTLALRGSIVKQNFWLHVYMIVFCLTHSIRWQHCRSLKLLSRL